MTVNLQQHLVSTNRFLPLATLTYKHEGLCTHASSCIRPQSEIQTKETSLQHITGWKIPTIVNGRNASNCNINKNPIRIMNKQHSTSNQKFTKFVNKVEIIGDSHLKGLAVKINQYLNTKVKVCSLTKPGASTNQLVCSQTNDFKCLGKSDTIVINGGTNDVDTCKGKDKSVLISMVNFMQKYNNNTNIVILNIPHRYDLMKLDKWNLCIQAYNSKLKNMLKTFKHVALVEMSTNRSHYTKHGFHLNRQGKEWLAKQIVKQIEMLVEVSSKSNPAIPLKWLEESPNFINDNNRLTSESKDTQGLIPSNQSNNNQISMGANDLLRRISTRNKKVPITMSKDFLWDSQVIRN